MLQSTSYRVPSNFRGEITRRASVIANVYYTFCWLHVHRWPPDAYASVTTYMQLRVVRGREDLTAQVSRQENCAALSRAQERLARVRHHVCKLLLRKTKNHQTIYSTRPVVRVCNYKHMFMYTRAHTVATKFLFACMCVHLGCDGAWMTQQMITFCDRVQRRPTACHLAGNSHHNCHVMVITVA